MAKCAYRGEKIREIEVKWIDENIRDEEEKGKKKDIVEEILEFLGEKADCRFEAIEGKDFCIFHDPEYWKDHGDELRKEFLKNLEEDEEKTFVGFHLPGIEFPKRVEKDLYMELAKFHGNLKVDATTFKEGVYFEGAVFEGDALFDKSKFKGEAIFYGATFEKGAAFNEVTFEGEAVFNGAVFKWRTYFIKVTFKVKAGFEESTFEELANFFETTFEDGATFVRAKIKGDAFFDGVEFKGLWFDEVTLEREGSFDEVAFEGEAWFRNLKYGDQAYVVFWSSLFKDPHLVTFRNTEMTNMLFLNTGIEEINIGDAKFRKVLRVHELLKNPNFMTRLTFDDVIETYGRLRGNLEKNHRFSDAGILFCGEMEARRERSYYETLRKHKKDERKPKEKITFSLRKVFLWIYVNFISPFALYKHISNYGESIRKPLIWSIATIFVMPFLFMLHENNYSLALYIDNLKLSISLFFQLSPVEYNKLSIGMLVLQVLERVLGIVLGALEILALRRRLERHP